MIRMKDLAAQLGLSQTTVSHVLSGRHEEFRISAKTVARVKQIAEKLDYRSNALAKSLRDRRSYSVGLVVEDLSNPFWTGLAIGAELEAEKHGYTLIVTNTGGDVERERRALMLLRDGRVDGLLLPPFARIDRDLTALHKERLPFVQIDRALARLEVPCVRTDHALGSHMVVEALVRRGHRRIAFLLGPTDIQPYRLRLAGFKDALAQHKLAPAAIIQVPEGTAEAGQAAVAEELRKGPRFSALYAGNIWLTVGTLRAVREAGLQVPKDLEIVGFDDIALADLLRYPITTVVQDVATIGREAFKQFVELQAGRSVPDEVLIPPRLEVR